MRGLVGSRNAFVMLNNEYFKAKAFRSKRAQFFILSAVIIAAIIVSMASIKNFVITGNVPSKMYYYGDQLDSESGAVIDYNLYNSASGNLKDFLQKAINYSKNNFPGLDVYSCYSSSPNSNTLSCQNNGSLTISINSPATTINPLSSANIDITNLNSLTMNVNGNNYQVPLLNSSIVREQFYFIIRVNTSSGEFIDVSKEMKN
jgi:hypothetical protein